MTLRILGVVLAVSAVSFNLTTCRGPGEQKPGGAPSADAPSSVDLGGVDTSELTGREKQDWSTYVSELLAPCSDVPVSVAQCVKEARDCKSCLPAARFLVRQVRKGLPRTKVEAAFRARFAPELVKSVDLGGSPFKGPEGAPVTIVEWADFECPFCGQARPRLEEMLEAYPNKVRIVFRNYPLSMHPHAESAARAAVAAGLQGKFWQMHAALFENQQSLEKVTIERLARDIGVDVKRFTADWNSEAVAEAVAKDRKAGDAMGLEGTPLIYVNGRHFNLDFFDLDEDLDEWIQFEIEARTGQKVKPVAVKAPAAPALSLVPQPSAAPSAKPALSAGRP